MSSQIECHVETEDFENVKDLYDNLLFVLKEWGEKFNWNITLRNNNELVYTESWTGQDNL